MLYKNSNTEVHALSGHKTGGHEPLGHDPLRHDPLGLWDQPESNASHKMFQMCHLRLMVARLAPMNTCPPAGDLVVKAPIVVPPRRPAAPPTDLLVRKEWILRPRWKD